MDQKASCFSCIMVHVLAATFSVLCLVPSSVPIKLKLAVWTFKRSGNSLLRYVSQSFNCSHLLSGAELIFPYARDATYNLRINNSSMLELV